MYGQSYLCRVRSTMTRCRTTPSYLSQTSQRSAEAALHGDASQGLQGCVSCNLRDGITGACTD
eukprot:97939-Amphidinium_carterae.1